MKTCNYNDIAQILYEAERNKQEITRITLEYPDLTIEEAYEIQERLVSLKKKAHTRVFGPKMGLTSRAKMEQMNVKDPIYGYILDHMVHENNKTIPIEEFIHPKVEAEIAFILENDIEGPGITGAQVLANTKYVVGALEIIDSRYENFQFTLPDVIADNASSSKVVLGDKIINAKELELDLVGVTLSINGNIVEMGAGAAVLSHPANSVATLANMLARKGGKLNKGEIILTGGITSAVMINRGDYVSAKFDGIGEVNFKMK
ncbi:2-keto-4-pentenoate hydratase [Anaerobacillus isosaccharinicus]|uniref:2-keto-4-pentenoate hydratase n=1 Tax=Anaerobacillus isosaccharinicus TaxID=1532552 RepID=A0A1S2M8U7_9BACI|nr:2-keto-4-pentenoate hydratase [Anaerobacillus isosaccharinicus]MBA5587190.1 fumarylacetoacetate hydrolase family protein [Anaerobacillus isosaccharinicus]QOY34614.1 2-keto-4-pentenoate hydratase [Anaerobacillus isosaccharinicus]